MLTNRRLARCAAAALGTGALALAGTLAGGPGADGASAARPNVIVVMTDDQSVAQLSERTMPETLRALGRRGTEFSRSIVSSPLCCPSRAGLISGQYPHNDGVFDNEPGYPSLTDKRSTLYSWLAGAGYRTGHVGRFLLNYDREPAPGDPPTDGGLAAPPGVETWLGFVGGATAYYGATFGRDGEPVTLSQERSGYTTRAINREALDFVRASRDDPRPFFLNVAHLAPHSTNLTGPGKCGIGGLPLPERGALAPFADDPLPQPPSFNERRIADKPAWIESRPSITARKRRLLRRAWRCALATLTTVDRGVGRIVEQLRRQGELGETAIFFTSDNGYLYGEHRVFLNKVFPYEEALRVPLIARLPSGARQPRRVGAPVSNVDVTATILDLAGASPCADGAGCRVLDGRSLLPLLRDRRPAWADRRGLLVQIGSVRECGSGPTDALGLKTFYDAIRTRRYLYVELDRVNRETGECDRPEVELYDLRRDPFQLRNRASAATPSAVQRALASRLQTLRSCSGVAGRDPAGAAPFCE